MTYFFVAGIPCICDDGGVDPRDVFALPVPLLLVGLCGCPEDSVRADDEVGTSAETGVGMGMDMGTGGGGCPLDPFDPNDSARTAAVTGSDTTLVATLCSPDDDVDWWTFTIAEPSYVGVEVLFAKDGQDLRLELSDRATGMVIDSSEGGADILAAPRATRAGQLRRPRRAACRGSELHAQHLRAVDRQPTRSWFGDAGVLPALRPR